MLGTLLQWLKEDLTTAKEHAILTVTLLALGFLGGYFYQASKVADLELRLTRISSGKMGYRASSNVELKEKVTDLIVQLRAFIKVANKETTDLRLACDHEQGRGDTDERRTQIRRRCIDDSARATEKHVAIYNERFKSEAILLREEILFRLPIEYRTKISNPILFDFPQNPLGFEMIVTSLELLGKSLPNR